ncbi:MAG: hypothetical protein ACRC0F_00275 [Cetobacterium sp.]
MEIKLETIRGTATIFKFSGLGFKLGLTMNGKTHSYSSAEDLIDDLGMIYSFSERELMQIDDWY